jgi:predicted O-methyltransferase YrrM
MNRFFAGFSRRLAFALRNPVYAVKALAHEAIGTDAEFLALVSGSEKKKIQGYLNEPLNNRDFYNHLRQSETTFRETKTVTSADPYATKVALQYALVRALKPEIILETGVASGVSSSYLLLALKANGKGILHSIEIADTRFLPQGRQNGWIIPDWLRERWKLHVGDARNILGQVAGELAPLDIFIHDSLHTDEHMSFEFKTAFPFLRPGGLLLADDALWNSAFSNFAAQLHAPLSRIVHGVGVLHKSECRG